MHLEARSAPALAQTLWNQGRYNDALRTLASDAPSAAGALLAARCYERLRRYDEALTTLRDAGAHLTSGDEALEAAAIAATCFAAKGDTEASRAYVGMLETTGVRISPRLRATLLVARGSCAWMRGDLIEAEALVASVEPAAGMHALAQAKFVRSWIRWSRGKSVEQAALLVEALQVLERSETPDVGLAARCLYALAAVSREYHMPHCARVVAELLPRFPWTADLQVERFQTLRLTAWSCALQAAYIPAIRHLHAARDAAPSPYYGVLSRFDRAWVSRIAGERASFEAEALAAAEIALALDWTVPSGEESTALLVGAEMLAAIDAGVAQALLDRYEGARAAVAHSMAIRQDPKIVALQAVAAAAIADARNDVNGVRRSAKVAFDVYDGLGVGWRAAWCALLLYRAGCGDEWLRVARANIADYPHSFVAAELERIESLRAGVKGGELTARQREIFSLLMEGRTIDDIASHLICSRNTVRVHVGAIYRKVGVRNRVELLTQAAAL